MTRANDGKDQLLMMLYGFLSSQRKSSATTSTHELPVIKSDCSSFWMEDCQINDFEIITNEKIIDKAVTSLKR